MNIITLDRDHYRYISKYEEWCENNVGPGGWFDRPGDRWHIKQIFGYTDFYFVDPADRISFKKMTEEYVNE